MIDEGDVCPKEPPTVMCPAGVSATSGTAVTLTASGSDPDGGSVTYAWTVVTAPVGSTAMPATPTAASTAFTPDVAGSYTLQFCVTDDEGTKTCCTVAVETKAACTPPTAPTVSTCGTSWDRRPIIEFAALPSGLSYEVFSKEGTAAATSLGTVTTVGQNYYRPPTAIAPGGPRPGTPVSLYVKACKTDDATCCAISSVVTSNLVESCTTPEDITTSSPILFSEYIIDGEGSCSVVDGGINPDCEAGEAIEITNLSNCPLRLSGAHFSSCNDTCADSSIRYMNFGSGDIIPPRGVYVAVRNRGAATCSVASLGSDDATLFGLKVSGLAMQGTGLESGWFKNADGGTLRIATGSFDMTAKMSSGTTITSRIWKNNASCGSYGINAVDQCGDPSTSALPTALSPSQLGRLWHPCDSVLSATPACSKP
jgi:hypothetical protein